MYVNPIRLIKLNPHLYPVKKPPEVATQALFIIYHVNEYTCTSGAIHSTKISGNFGPKLNGSVRSNRKSFEKNGTTF